jgi:hypothetical protein
VQTPNFGLVTGRVSALALDPADASGNRLYVGTTGGGVWLAQNAGTANLANIAFTPLTDSPAALSGVRDPSISIGAITVQPGGTGVILAGTGDPNDGLDSYYGGGILRSPDGGSTWNLIPGTPDQKWVFLGEGLAGFAWSTVNPQLVVAAVSQAYEGTLVNAALPNFSYQGLYYSTDAGASWALARITDGGSSDVQGPNDTFAHPDGNAATAVVWNPVRQLFVAAVRYHGYYQSTDGITWTRLAAQPGAGLSAQFCPTHPGSTGSTGCPIFRGTLAVNPLTGDTFAWTVDLYNQDQGLWQDQCAVSAGACTAQAIAFAKQWSTSALETSGSLGFRTIRNGDYNLALAAIPSGQDTVLMAGANDLWKCSLAMGCAWRNTTNAATCMSAQVGPYQHALAWNPANPQEIFLGNDSGLWRSTDGIAETGSVCAAADATHFQNLNGGLGSLAEVESLSQVGNNPYTAMAGLGANGTAGVKGAQAPVPDWPSILGGEGGPVAIDPVNGANWYVNNQAGVSIHMCSQAEACTPAAFGAAPVVDDADVSGDGLTMTAPAPFLVDPLDNGQLLVGTCRVWRGPVSGGWTGTNAISAILDGSGGASCSGDPLIRSIAAMALPSGGEVVYAGIYGASNGGAGLAGHIFAATVNPAKGGSPVWQDLTENLVSNDTRGFNSYGFDISSIVIDSHDPTGNTVYVTVEGIRNAAAAVRPVYRSIDGGAHWRNLTSNLPPEPANSLAVDPQDANTVYIATDGGVFSTRQVSLCEGLASSCWAPFGSGLPGAPAVELSASPATASAHVLAAGTYGRGIWMAPLWTAGQNLTTASATPASLTFSAQAFGTVSSAQTVTVKNTGQAALMPASIVMSGDFSETDNCQNAIVLPGASCAIQVVFAPTTTGSRTGFLTLSGNIAANLTVALSGTGAPSGVVTLTPSTLTFGPVPVGTTSGLLPVTAANNGAIDVPVSAVTITAPFAIASSSCGGTLAAKSSCGLMVDFAPVTSGPASGTLTFTDAAGAQTVALSGSGQAGPTDSLSPASLTFGATATGQVSASQPVTLTNSGDLPLASIAVSVSAGFQISNKCAANLAGHSSCAVAVAFAPTQTGSLTGALSVTDALRSQSVALVGLGVQKAALGVSPQSLSFAPVPVGQASPPSTVTVSNTGGLPLAGLGFQISGAGAKQFSCGATTCSATNCGTSLAGGASCTVQVTFSPAAAGGSVATFTVSAGGVAAVSIPMSGSGQALAGLNVQPSHLVFPIVAPGQSSQALPVTVSNTGSAAAVSLTFSAAPPFALAATTCGASLAAGASCSLGVVFSPALDGVFSGALTVASTAATNSASVALTGQGGVPGSVRFQPAQLLFPQTAVGQPSAAGTVTITNPDSVASLSGFAVSVPPGFRVVANTCPALLPPLASCTVSVVFIPASPGPQNGALIASDSVLPQGSFLAMSGLGFDFALAPSGSSTQVVANGQVANYKLVVTPLLGSQGVFSFQCGTLPPYSKCIYNPTTVGIPANSSGYEGLQIATGLAQTASAAPRPIWPAVPLVCGVLLPLALWRRRKALLLAALLAILAGGAVSCTSSGGYTGGTPPPSGPGITPAGTYAVPVTVQSNNVAHKITLTLTVD